MSKETFPKGVIHTIVSSHNGRFIKGDLLNKPIELHTGYTQRWGAYCNVSRISILCETLVTGHWVHRQRGGLRPHPDDCNGGMHLMQWKSSGAPHVTPGRTKLKLWVIWVLSSYSPQGWVILFIWVSRWRPLSECPDLWFWVFCVSPKGIPITLYDLISELHDESDFLLSKDVQKPTLLLLY